MYSLADYGEMLAEPIRLRSYTEALASTIRPGCVVLELGTGPGVLALVAARLGARRVLAVEPSDAIDVGRQLALANDLNERIEFFQGLSTDLNLPERADVIVSDLRGVLPLFQDHLPSIVDARERFLAPGGCLIPRTDSLWASVVTAEEVYQKVIQGWVDTDLDCDLSPALDLVTKSWRKARIAEDQCLVEPQRWAVLDYRVLDDPDVSGRLGWQVSQRGTAHGLALWFDTRLTENVGFTNAPGQPELLYGQGFFPFPRPVELHPGDELEVSLEARWVRQDYMWRWQTTVEGVSGDRLRFDQSNWHAMPLSPSRLRKQAASYIPELRENGRIEHFILSQMDGEQTLEGIAQNLQSAFPGRFGRWSDALTLVANLAQRCG